MRLSSGDDEQHAVLARAGARRCGWLARSSTSTIAPSGRPRRSTPATRASTRSPCSTLCISRGGRNRSAPPSSRHEEAEAVGMALDAPGNEMRSLRDEQRACAVADDLARRAPVAARPRSNALRSSRLHPEPLAEVSSRDAERPARSALRGCTRGSVSARIRGRSRRNRIAAPPAVSSARVHAPFRCRFSRWLHCLELCSVRISPPAEVAELVDALGSGPSGGNTVGVRVPSSAPSFSKARSGRDTSGTLALAPYVGAFQARDRS